MEFEKVRELAHRTLNAAIDEKGQQVIREYLDALQDGQGLAGAMICWVDLMLDHAADGQPVDVDVDGMIGYNYDTGEITPNLPAPVAWAGELIKARANKDDSAVTALFRQVADREDGYEQGQYLLAVLNVTAYTIRGTPRGYTLMGL